MIELLKALSREREDQASMFPDGKLLIKMTMWANGNLQLKAVVVRPHDELWIDVMWTAEELQQVEVSDMIESYVNCCREIRDQIPFEDDGQRRLF